MLFCIVRIRLAGTVDVNFVLISFVTVLLVCSLGCCEKIDDVKFNLRSVF